MMQLYTAGDHDSIVAQLSFTPPAPTRLSSLEREALSSMHAVFHSAAHLKGLCERTWHICDRLAAHCYLHDHHLSACNAVFIRTLPAPWAALQYV